MIQEISAAQSLSVITGQYLDQVPVFKVDPFNTQNALNNARRQVLRSLFQPMVLYLVEQKNIAAVDCRSPEAILNAAIGIPDLQSDLEVVEQIRSRYCQQGPDQPQRDWLQESSEISLADNMHPLKKLSQAVTGKLSENARQELTKMGFTG